MIDKTLKLGVVYTRRDLTGEFFMNPEAARKSKEVIEVVPVTLMELKSRYESVLENEKGYLEERLENYHENFEVLVNDTALRNTAALAKAIAEWAEERELGVIAQAAAGWRKASFFADITVRHPQNNNAELFWHCGVFPKSVACKTKKPVINVNFDEKRPAGIFRIFVPISRSLPLRKFRGDCAENADRNLFQLDKFKQNHESRR